MFAELLQVIRRIPRGKVSTYGEIARAAGHPGAARQVVWALRSPEARSVPWHRVVGAGGKILLQGEAGLDQQLRLAAEGIRYTGQRVLMSEHEHRFGLAPRSKQLLPRNSGKVPSRARRRSPGARKRR
ncbi:MAG: MGMT family protein [Candidatus Korobacteraceae bacterium]